MNWNKQGKILRRVLKTIVPEHLKGTEKGDALLKRAYKQMKKDIEKGERRD